MTLNIYVMPIVVVGRKGDRQPKYAASVFPTWDYGMMDYGNEPWCLVGITDIDGPTDAAITANADADGLPQNLDQLVSPVALSTVQNALESVNIPGTWIATTNSYRDVVRFIGAVSQFAQKFQGATGGVWFTGGVTLATHFNTLPQAVRTGLVSAAASFGFDTSGVSGATTLRAILLSVGQQYLATQPPIKLDGVNL